MITEEMKAAVAGCPGLQEWLRQVSTWIMDNDYECGEVGGEIHTEIHELLGESDD